MIWNRTVWREICYSLELLDQWKWVHVSVYLDEFVQKILDTHSKKLPYFQTSWTVSSHKSHGIYKTSQFNNHNKVLTFSYMYMYLEGFFPVRGDICPRVVWVQVSKHFSKKLEWNKNRVMGISSFLLQNSSHFCFFLFYMPVNWLMQNLEQ